MTLIGEDPTEVTHVWRCRYRDSSIQSSRLAWCQLLRKKKKKKLRRPDVMRRASHHRRPYSYWPRAEDAHKVRSYIVL